MSNKLYAQESKYEGKKVDTFFGKNSRVLIWSNLFRIRIGLFIKILTIFSN